VPVSPQAFPLDDSIYASYMGTYEGYGCKASVERSGQDYYFVWNDVEVTPFYPISETRFHHTKHDSEYEFKRNAQGELSFLGMHKKQDKS
jgi:hypothetical protein